MDYEKKYKEALEWARKVMQGKVGFVLDEVLEIFPELRESEDERVREALITYFQKFPYGSIGDAGTNVNEAIAWLEKQGKNNMGISEATKQKLEDNLNEALEKETPESWNEFLEKQGGQKPAWSEEDERIRIETIELLETANHPNKMHSNGKPLDFTENINWLKSLHPQNHWKPSEEQLNALYDAAVYVDKSMFPYPKGILMKLYKQLMKLREQSYESKSKSNRKDY